MKFRKAQRSRTVATTTLIASLAYMASVGALGVTSKVALRHYSWQTLVVWTTVAYGVAVVIVVMSGGRPVLHGDLSGVMLILSGIIPPLSLVLLFLALERSDASVVVPITAAYPLVTIALAALFLGERLSLGRAMGAALVVLGVVLLTIF